MDAKMESQTLSDLEALFDDSVDTRKMWGWYQDAGDWDSYVSHSDIPAFLLTTFELKPKNFSDNDLNIPESGNGIPDIIDEASWLLNHYRRTKGPTGGNAGGRIEGDSIAEWESQALKAFTWAQNNLREGDENKIRSPRADAGAWLYKLTGEKCWLDKFKSDLEVTAEDNSKFEKYRWGIWAYITTSEKKPNYDKQLKTELLKATENYAQTEVTDAIDKNRSYRMGGSMKVRTEVGQATTPLVMPAIIAWEATHKIKYLKAVYSTCDYMLGGNQLDMTWITGVGSQYPTQVFNMDWWYNKKGIKEVVPGIVPYGPTADCDWMPGKNGDCNAWGWWDSDYAHSKLYPDKSQWPVHERWYNNRYAPPSSEYTVHQNIGPAAAVYGYLTKTISK